MGRLGAIGVPVVTMAIVALGSGDHQFCEVKRVAIDIVAVPTWHPGWGTAPSTLEALPDGIKSDSAFLSSRTSLPVRASAPYDERQEDLISSRSLKV